MGDIKQKYHVSKDGKVFQINDDGSFTELGNISQLTYTDEKNSKRTSKVWKRIAIFAIILIVAVCIGFSLVMLKTYDDLCYYRDQMYYLEHQNEYQATEEPAEEAPASDYYYEEQTEAAPASDYYYYEQAEVAK